MAAWDLTNPQRFSKVPNTSRPPALFRSADLICAAARGSNLLNGTNPNCRTLAGNRFGNWSGYLVIKTPRRPR